MKVRSRCDKCLKFGPKSLIDRDCPDLWESKACCGTMRRVDLVEHVGLHANRLSHPCSAREKAFADLWRDENQFSSPSSTLVMLLDRQPTQDEATAVATVIQWLGSNCGQWFVNKAVEMAKAVAK